MARARGANAVMAAAFETTYGTPPAAGYKKLPFVSSALGNEQNLIASDLLGYLPKPKQPITGPGGVQAAFAFQAAEDPTLQKTLTAALVNDVSAY